MNTNSELLTMREERACQKQNSRDAACCIWTAARMCPGLCQVRVQQICHGKRLWVWGTESLVCEEGGVLLVRGWKPPALSQMMREEGKGKALNITSTAGEENVMLGSGLRCLGHRDGLLPCQKALPSKRGLVNHPWASLGFLWSPKICSASGACRVLWGNIFWSPVWDFADVSVTDSEAVVSYLVSYCGS